MIPKTIAALQLGSSPEGTAATLEKILGYKEKITASHCDLVVLPEALLGGYPKGADFGTRVGYRSEEGRADYLAYYQQAISMDGPEVEALVNLAIACKSALVIGIIERSGSTLYCSALLISETGEIAKHRKLMPTASERLIWGQGDGSTLPVLNTGAGRIGAAICWENYMPLLRTTMYAKGLDIWCAPTVDEREIWQTSMRHIAYEGRNFLISACQYQGAPAPGRAKDPDWPEGRALIRGGSIIVSPMGEVLAGPLYDEEGLITAEIELDDIVKARYDMDPVGHYARPDVFKLVVNEEERPALTRVRHDALEKPD